MKRSPALAALSRDHHHALVIAQKLGRVNRPTAARARAAFLTYWQEDGERHFQLEERHLLPAYLRHRDADDRLVARVLADHTAIRAAAAALAAAATPEPGGAFDRARARAADTGAASAASAGRDVLAELNALHALGLRLAAHVRLEERELFPAIEQALAAAELSELAEKLSG